MSHIIGDNYELLKLSDKFSYEVLKKIFDNKNILLASNNNNLYLITNVNRETDINGNIKETVTLKTYDNNEYVSIYFKNDDNCTKLDFNEFTLNFKLVKSWAVHENNYSASLSFDNCRYSVIKLFNYEQSIVSININEYNKEDRSILK